MRNVSTSLHGFRRPMIVAVASALLLAWPLAASSLPRESERWIELTTPNFTIFSSSTERQTRRIAENLEQLRTALGRLMEANVTSPVPTYVYVFQNDKKFDPYKPLYQGRPADLSGYFTYPGHANYIAINGARSLDTNHIVYHEYVHFVLSYSMPDLPVWLDEGLAEFYGSFVAEGNRANFGRPVLEHLYWLRQNGLLPLRELFAIDHDSPEYNEGTRQGVFYAQSWALVHLLLMGETHKGELSRYLKLTGDGMGEDEALAEAFGTDYGQLGKDLLAYVNSPSMNFFWVDVEAFAESTAITRRMSHPEVLARLGDLLSVVEGREADAALHLEAALKANRNDALALTGLGFLAQRQDRLAEALSYYRRALASAGDDFMAYYRYGECLLMAAGSVEPERTEAQSALRRSLELNPDFAPTWAALAYIGSFETEPSDATKEVAETAYAKLPSRDDVASSLLLILARRGEKDAAQRLFARHFVSHASPEALAQARSALLEMDLREVARLNDEGRLEDALKLLETLRGRGGNPRENDLVEEHLRDLRAAVEDKRFVDEYNRAVNLLNRGEFASAKEILRKLADEEVPRAGQARALLSKVESRTSRKQR